MGDKLVQNGKRSEKDRLQKNVSRCERRLKAALDILIAFARFADHICDIVLKFWP